MKLKNFFSGIFKKIREMDPKVKRVLLIALCLAVVAATVITTVVVLTKDKGGNDKGNGAGGTIITGDGNTEYVVKVHFDEYDHSPYLIVTLIYSDEQIVIENGEWYFS